MAKRDEKFWSDLAQAAGLDDATRTALLAAVKNDKFEKGLYDSLVPREESMQQLNEANRIKAESDKAKADAIANYQANLQWRYANAQKLDGYDTLSKKVQLYESMYGNADGNNANGAANGNGQQPKYLTAEEMEAAVNARQRAFWTLQRQLRRAEIAYQKQFGEPLPDAAIDELEQLAGKPENANRSFTDMFTEWVSPKMEERRTSDIEARIKAAREEGEKAGYAKARTTEPAASAPEELSPLYVGRPEKDKAPDQRTIMQNFIDGLEPPQGTATR